MCRGFHSFLPPPRGREVPLRVPCVRLLLSLALFGLLGLTAAPARAEQTYSQSMSFQALSQSIWGNPISSPNVNDVFAINWDGSASAGGIVDLDPLGKYGAKVSVSTAGQLGLRARAYVKDGLVSVNYPFQVTLRFPDNDTLRPGDRLTISWDYAPTAGASLATTSPKAGAGLDLIADARFDGSIEGAIAGAAFKDQFLQIGIGPFDAEIVDTDDAGFRAAVTGGSFLLSRASRGVLTGSYKDLDLQTSSNSATSTGTLQSSGDSTFFTARANITNLLLSLVGAPPLNTTISFEDPFTLKLEFQVLSAWEQLDFKVAQSFEFSPNPALRLSLSDGQGADLKVGETAELRFPMNPEVTITPTVILDNKLTNRTNVVISPSLNFVPLSVNFEAEVGPIDVGPFSLKPVDTLTWNQGDSTFSLFNSSFALNGTTIGATPPINLVGYVYPTPTLDEVSETLIRQGTGGRELLARGSNFVDAYSNDVMQFPSSTAQFNGSGRETQFGTSTELRFQFTDADANTEGIHRITVKNPAPGGGVSNERQVIVDGTPPVTTALLDGPQAPIQNGWYIGDVTVRLSAMDNLSGVKVIDYVDGNGSSRSHTPPFAVGPSPVEAPPFVVSGDGVRRIDYRSTDNVDLAELVQSTEVRIDGTPPVVRASRSPEPNQHGWNNSDVTVTFECSDNLSGILSCPAPEVLSAEFDNHEVTGLAGDVAGNTARATVSRIKIDKTPPVLTGSLNPPANQHGWNNSPVTVRFTCEDALSGLATPCPDDQTLKNEGANQSVNGSATDKADNTTAATIGPINIDWTPPAIQGSRTPAANEHGWNNTPVTVRFECSDALAGVAQCPGDTVLSSEGTNQSVSGTVTDRADNSASAVVEGLSIDMTPPAIAYSGNAGTYTVDQQVNIICASADNLSGVLSDTCQPITGPAYRFALGENTFSATATDRAGNQGSGSTSFTVRVTYVGLCSLVERLVSHDGIATSLCQKLQNAQAAGERGDAGAKANILEAFVQEVAAQTGQYISAENASVLTALARAL